MVEIIVLIMLAQKIGKIAESKGRKKGRYQFLLVGLWIGGEVFGALVGGVLMALADGTEESAGCLAVVLAYGMAIVGAVVAFQIVKNLQPLNEDEHFPLRGVELERWGDKFKPREAALPSADDAYTERPERSQRTEDDRIQP
jgi:hypothetical protein